MTEDELEVWLQGQSQEVCCLISTRSVARVLGNVCSGTAPIANQLALPALRAMLASATGAVSGSPDLDRRMFVSAANFAYDATRDLPKSAYSAIHVVLAGDHAAQSAGGPSLQSATSTFCAVDHTSLSADKAVFSAAYRDTSAPTFETPL